MLLYTSDSQNYVHDRMAQCMLIVSGKLLFSDYSITIFPAFQYHDIFHMQVRFLFQIGAKSFEAEWDTQWLEGNAIMLANLTPLIMPSYHWSNF